MKYDGLRKLETTNRQVSGVVCLYDEKNEGNPHVAKGKGESALGKMQENDKLSNQQSATQAPQKAAQPADKAQAFEKAAQPADKAQASEKAADKAAKPKKRRFFVSLVKQVVICAIIVGGLAFLRFIDSGFSAEVFKGVKDIVSYNFELPATFS